MGNLFYRFRQNIIECFSPHNLLWHLAAIITTWIIVVSGFDWFYFLSVRGNTLDDILFPAVAMGVIVPIILPIYLILLGKTQRNTKLTNTGFSTLQPGQ